MEFIRHENLAQRRHVLREVHFTKLFLPITDLVDIAIVTVLSPVWFKQR